MCVHFVFEQRQVAVDGGWGYVQTLVGGGGKLMPHSLFPLSKLNDFKHMSFIYFLDCLTSYNTTLLAAVFTGELKY